MARIPGATPHATDEPWGGTSDPLAGVIPGASPHARPLTDEEQAAARRTRPPGASHTNLAPSRKTRR